MPGIALASAGYVLKKDSTVQVRNSNRHEAEAEIREFILAYWVEHPEASDTADGITSWWLLEEAIKRDSAIVRKVLDDLVAELLVLEHRSQDGRRRFQLNQQRLSEIRQMLARSGDPRGN